MPRGDINVWLQLSRKSANLLDHHNLSKVFHPAYPSKVPIRDILELRDSLMLSGSSNMHQPMNLVKHMEQVVRNKDASKSLLMLLSEHVRRPLDK